MPRIAKPYWCRREQAWRTNAGGRTHYFRGVARDDQVSISRAFADYLAALDAANAPVELLLCEMCLRFVEASRGVELRTVMSHRERLGKFCGWGDPPLGARLAKQIKAFDLSSALRAWEALGLSDHYRAGIARSVKAAFAWAASDDARRLIDFNPMVQVKVPKIERSPERYAARGELAQFFWLASRIVTRSPSLYRRFGRLLLLMLRVAAHTGIRPGDLASTWWSDFDPSRGVITLPPDRHKTGSKTGRPLIVFLGPSLTRSLVRWRDRREHHPVSIFTHKRGRGGVSRGTSADQGEPWGRFVSRGNRETFVSNTTPLSQSIRKLRLKVRDEHGVRLLAWLAAGRDPVVFPALRVKNDGDNRFVFYRLRHTVASDFLMRGGASATVAELLGTSPRMLETTYGHLLEDHLTVAAADLRVRKKPGAAGHGSLPT